VSVGRQRRLNRLGLDASARKIKLLLVFRLTAYNLRAIRSFLAKIAIVAEAARKSRTRKRLEQAWVPTAGQRPFSGAWGAHRLGPASVR
jgi:hypothetical protein